MHVVVDWSDADAPSAAPARVELETDPERNSDREASWICRQPTGSSWEEALATAGHLEIVLTAELDDDPAAKHLVFGLAERLTLSLAATRPVVRVRFLPTPSKRAHRVTRPTTRQQ